MGRGATARSTARMSAMGGKRTLTPHPARVISCVMRWSLTDPSPREAIIVDEAAEEAACISLGRDVAELGYSLHNARVSRLADAKIVRLDDGQ